MNNRIMRSLNLNGFGLSVLFGVFCVMATGVHAQEDKRVDPEYLRMNVTSSYVDEGKHFTEEDIPTFSVKDDGTLDWPSYSGFRRYHSECHVCHGPEGEGSTYAPALKLSAIEMDYYDFVDVVVNGIENVGVTEQSVMPSFGDNVNVMCYLDDIYVYLKGRGMEAIPRGRPRKREQKTAAFGAAEKICLGLEQ